MGASGQMNGGSVNAPEEEDDDDDADTVFDGNAAALGDADLPPLSVQHGL